jgi:hypothetical protein
MRFKSSLIALSLSLVCFIPRVALADTLTLTDVGPGNNIDGVYTYPYDFTVTGPGGTDNGVAMSCLNFNREITFGETWLVDPLNLSSVDPNGTYDGESGTSLLEDAWLYNQYGTAAGADSEIQFAIWSIMDPGDINASNSSYTGANAFDATAQALAAQAIAEVTGSQSAALQLLRQRPRLPARSQRQRHLDGRPAADLHGGSAGTAAPASRPLRFRAGIAAGLSHGGTALGGGQVACCPLLSVKTRYTQPCAAESLPSRC